MDYNTPGGLVETLVELERRLQDLERATRLNLSAIQQGGITIEDASGVARLLLGQQADGTYGLQAFDPSGAARVTIGQTGVSRYGSLVSDPNVAGANAFPTKDLYYPAFQWAPPGNSVNITSLSTVESGLVMGPVAVSPQTKTILVVAAADVVPSPANATAAMGIGMGIRAYQRGLHTTVLAQTFPGAGPSWPINSTWKQTAVFIGALQFAQGYELSDATGGVDIYFTYNLTLTGSGTVQVSGERAMSISL